MDSRQRFPRRGLMRRNRPMKISETPMGQSPDRESLNG